MSATPPAHLWVPDGVRGNYGDEVADVAELVGRPLDASQRIAVDALTSYGTGGRWLALEGVVKKPRQNGKTGGIITPIVLADLFLWPADRIAWTAHLFKTCREAFADHKLLIDGVPEFRRRVRKISEANGEESIELTSGARLDYLARSKGGGRGLGGKRVVFDEALFGTMEQSGAMLPILAARDDPQVTYGSSACKTESGLLRALTRRGRAGNDPSLIFVEWCAPGGWAEPECADGVTCTHVYGAAVGCALDREDYWRASNSAMATRRIGVAFMRSMRRTLSPLEFGREFLGWDEAGEDEADRPISLEAWTATATTAPPSGEPTTFFVDIEPGMRSAAIAVSTTGPGRDLHVEIDRAMPGTDWVVSRMAELRRRYPAAMFGGDATGAIGTLLPDLERAGFDLQLLTGPDMGRACGHIQSLVRDEAITHLDEPVVTVALAGAVKRPVGDGLWAWGRRRSTVNICPLVAMTGAAWLAELHRESNADPLASLF